MADWPDNSVDLVFADPPFNIGKKYGTSDNRPDYKNWCSLWISECFRLLKPTGSFYLMTLTRHLEFTLHSMAQDGVFVNLISWRNVSAAHGKRSFWGEYQPIALYGKTENYIFNTYAETIDCKPELKRWGSYSTEYRGQLKDRWDDITYLYGGSILHKEAIALPGTKTKIHPCQMPIDLPARAIRFSTVPEYIVLEPFAGLGTSCVAAKMLGRRYIGIDISEKYCQIARQRLEAVDTGVPVKEQNAGQLALFGKEGA